MIGHRKGRPDRDGSPDARRPRATASEDGATIASTEIRPCINCYVCVAQPFFDRQGQVCGQPRAGARGSNSVRRGTNDSSTRRGQEGSSSWAAGPQGSKWPGSPTLRGHRRHRLRGIADHHRRRVAVRRTCCTSRTSVFCGGTSTRSHGWTIDVRTGTNRPPRTAVAALDARSRRRRDRFGSESFDTARRRSAPCVRRRRPARPAHRRRMMAMPPPGSSSLPAASSGLRVGSASSGCCPTPARLAQLSESYLPLGRTGRDHRWRTRRVPSSRSSSLERKP